ncbi:MAG: polysaccharide deacetylase family protein [Calditrichia bacterium]
MKVFWDIPESEKHNACFLRMVDICSHNAGFFRSEKPEAGLIHLKIEDRPEGSPPVQLKNGMVILSQNYLKKMMQILECRNTFSRAENADPFADPVVDEWVRDTAQAVRQCALNSKQPLLIKQPWPENKPFAAAITHDVDLTRKYGAKGLLKSALAGNGKRLLQTAAALFSGDNPYWNFTELLQFHRRKNRKATFFFLAREWEGSSYRYNVDSKSFRDLLKALGADGHEAALHTSKEAFQFPRRIGNEFRRLSKAAGADIKGVRQHYLKLEFPRAWKRFEQEGFFYDSSCGFNNIMGFRAGSSLPYQPFDIQKNEVYQIYEAPLIVMEYALLESAGSMERKLEKFKAVADKTKKTAGLLNLLWHPSNLAEPLFRPYWDEMMQWLDGQTVHTGTLNDLVEWRRCREQVQLSGFRAGEEVLEFILSSGCPVDGLSFHLLLENDKHVTAESAEVKKFDERQWLITCPHLQSGQNRVMLNLQNNA